MSVDARPLDTALRRFGIGRYAEGLLGELPAVAEERGGDLVVLRESDLRRPPMPSRAAEPVDQLLLPFELRRVRTRVHHTLSLYGTPAVSPARVVVTIHDLVPLQQPDEYLRTGLMHRLLYLAARRAAHVVCPTEGARTEVTSLLGVPAGRVSVAPYAADERFRPSDPAPVRGRLGLDGPYLLYVGALEDPRKDVAGLVEAFSAWRAAEGRSEQLVLSGAGRAPEAEGVVAAGFLPEEELPALLSGAECLVTASRHEGFGLPALEALACGTPVACLRTGALPETAGPGALLVEPGDTAGLMRAAGRLCDEPELAARLAEEGRRHAAGYSWRRTAELTWAAYEAAASLPRR